MKTQQITAWAVSRILGLALALALAIPAQAQKAEKERVRLSATYTKVMGGPVYLDLQATARVDNSNVDVAMADLDVYYELDGEEIALGQVQTDHAGKARFEIEGLGAIKPDSTGLYTLGASFGGNDAFRAASRTVSFRDAAITAELEMRDSLAIVNATLRDVAADSLIPEALIRVQVARLFRPLRISEEFLSTDSDGAISVEVPPGIPGKDGNLTLQVVIADNDDYGTVIAPLEAPVGTPFVEDNTYYQRTLWAPNRQAPLFIIAFTGILVLGSWGVIVYLIFNLIKIAKNKP